MVTRAEKIRATKLERERHLLIKASGPARYGFCARSDGVVERVPAEIAVIKTMNGMRALGASYQQIADRLNASHVKAPGGGETWYPMSVRNILMADYYRPRPIPHGLDGYDALRAAYVIQTTSVLDALV